MPPPLTLATITDMLSGTTTRYKVAAALIALSILVGIVWLIKKRKLREEYSWLWLLTGFGLLLLALWDGLLTSLATGLGITPPSTALFFFALIFMTLLSLEFSVRLSRQSEQIKNLCQRLAILDAKPPSGELSSEVDTSSKSDC